MSHRRSFVITLVGAVLTLGVAAAARAQTCDPLPTASGAVVDITPAQVGSLQSILDAARPGDTIQLADGVYLSSQTIVLRTPGVTLRSKSADRGAVVLDGERIGGDLLLIQQSDVTVADLTLTHSYFHLVHIVPGSGTLTGTVLHNIRGVDGGQQFIKVNPDFSSQYADNGTIRCSSFELTDAGRAAIRDNCYTGGIDIHQGRGWQIYANRFSGFWCGSGLSEHAIHLWNGSRDTRVDRNVVIDSARGIGFGLGSSVAGRTYSDTPCGTTNIGHYGGAITNNVVIARDPRLFASIAGFDTGIGLEQSCETSVWHNTVVSTTAPRSSSIEWRFSNTSASIANNLVSHNLLARDNGRAVTVGNVTNAPLSLFVDAAGADLHLISSATMAIDKAVPLSPPLATDLDLEPRGSAPDVGADEYYPVTPAPRSVHSMPHHW